MRRSLLAKAEIGLTRIRSEYWIALHSLAKKKRQSRQIVPAKRAARDCSGTRPPLIRHNGSPSEQKALGLHTGHTHWPSHVYPDNGPRTNPFLLLLEPFPSPTIFTPHHPSRRLFPTQPGPFTPNLVFPSGSEPPGCRRFAPPCFRGGSRCGEGPARRHLIHLYNCSAPAYSLSHPSLLLSWLQSPHAPSNTKRILFPAVTRSGTLGLSSATTHTFVFHYSTVIQHIVISILSRAFSPSASVASEDSWWQSRLCNVTTGCRLLSVSQYLVFVGCVQQKC